MLESECSLCDRTRIDTKPQSQSTPYPPQLKGRHSAFKSLPHTLRCKQVNPKYLQSLLDPIQELITGFAVWLEVFKSMAEGGRKGGMYLLLLLSWARWKKACRACQPAPREQKRQENSVICNPHSLTHLCYTHSAVLRDGSFEALRSGPENKQRICRSKILCFISNEVQQEIEQMCN